MLYFVLYSKNGSRRKFWHIWQIGVKLLNFSWLKFFIKSFMQELQFHFVAGGIVFKKLGRLK